MWLKALFGRHLGVKLLSLVLAVVLWYVAVGREWAEMGLNVPLELVNIPPDLVIANQIPDGASVRIRGSVNLTRQVAEKRLRFSLNLADAKEGPNQFNLQPDQLDLPRGLEITRLAPNSVTVELEPLVVKQVSILPVIKGEPPIGYIIEDIVLKPKQVQVQGPESVVGPVEILWTEPIDVTALKESATIKTELSLPDVSVTLAGPNTVEAQLRITEKIISRQFKDVPVTAVNAPELFRIDPKAVDLAIRGPMNALNALEINKGLGVSVDLSGLEPGRTQVPPQVAVPANMEVISIKPRVVKVQILKKPEPVGENGE
jgi:YbbR domain-containing protein